MKEINEELNELCIMQQNILNMNTA